MLGGVGDDDLFNYGDEGESTLSSLLIEGSRAKCVREFQEAGGVVHDIAFGWQHTLLLGSFP